MNFGTITGNRSDYCIKCAPHVRARLKRVFARAPKEASDVIFLRATPAA